MIPQFYMLAGAAAISFAAGAGLAWEYQGAKLKTCAVERDAIARDLTEQTDANEALREQGEKTRKKVAESVQATKPAADAAKARREALAARPAPDSCEAVFLDWGKP